jgi:hypothetical protein
MPAINLTEKLASFEGHWQPRVIGQFNGHDLMVVKVKGEFVWHTHENTDDFFLVLNGSIIIRMRDGDVSLGPGHVHRRIAQTPRLTPPRVFRRNTLYAGVATCHPALNP